VPEVVISGVASARNTLSLQGKVPNGGNGSGINWYVNGVAGGNNTFGTITANTADKGFATYTAPAAIPFMPDLNFVNITAQQLGTSGAAPGAISSPITVYVVSSNNGLATGSFNEGGDIVFRLRGFTASGLTYGIIGRFHMDGNGSANETTGINNGEEDINIAQPDGSSAAYTKVAFTGGYNMDTSSHGLIKLTVTAPPWVAAPPAIPPPSTMTLSFTLNLNALTGKIIEADAGGTYAGSGELRYQSPLAAFNSARISGGYAFSLAGPAGAGASAVHKGFVGRVDLVPGGTSTTGTIAATSSSDDQAGDPTQTLTGTYVLDGATNDHGTLNITAAPSGFTPIVSFFAVGPGLLYILETDPNHASANPGAILIGDAVSVSGAAFDNTALNGPSTFAALGITPSTAANGQGHASAMLGRFAGAPGAAGAGTLAGILDLNDGGSVPNNLPLTINAGSFTIAANGRGVMSVPVTLPTGAVTLKFVFYASSSSQGFLLEQPASDGSNRGRSGQWLLQDVNLPVKTSDALATFIAGTRTDTAASLNGVAVFPFNGPAGTFTGIGDASEVGFAPQLPIAGTAMATFAVTDQNNGRGTITATSGLIAGSAGAVFYVNDPAIVFVMGTDATLKEPQIITLNE
jgi:hypothetical protein